MKVLVITLLCALAGSACAGAVLWPNPNVALRGPVLNTIIPAQTKAFGYSTTQYINTLPPSYSLGLQPQFTYQVPHLSGISNLAPAYYPVSDLSYYPASVFYPSVGSIVSGIPSSPVIPSAPAAPSQPSQPPSAPSEQPSGDADTTVIDSADISSQQQRQEQPTATQPQSGSTPLPPANIFPNFPSFPQFPQGPQLPQLPQLPQIPLPSLPQIPQGPTNPFFPQSPAESSQSTFPGNISEDKGLNDEDTISVDSA